jgi:transposase
MEPAPKASSAQNTPIEEPRKIALVKLAPVTPRQRKGPKPFGPEVPRIVIRVPDPDEKQRICPKTGQPMKFWKEEKLEVLGCQPAQYFIFEFIRKVFVSDAKTAPSYSPWPDEVYGPSRAHASLLAHIFAERFGRHAPYYRLEQEGQRHGVHLARSYLVSLMELLNKTVQLLGPAQKKEVLAHDYVHVDATPVPACDPSKPGSRVETTVWTFQAHNGPVFYQHEYAEGKSPRHPDRTLKEGNFKGDVQTDAAAGLNKIGTEGQVKAYGCLAHARRRFHKAYKAKDKDAEPYLVGINRLFRIDRLAAYFHLSFENKAKLRQKYSLPLFDRLLAQAKIEQPKIPPDRLLGKALHYLIEQEIFLRRCVENPRIDLSNNQAERSIRNLKVGCRNWLQLGRPEAGARLANLFTLAQNCIREGIDPEVYMNDLLKKLPSCSTNKVAEMLPRAWKQARDQANQPADSPKAA